MEWNSQRVVGYSWCLAVIADAGPGKIVWIARIGQSGLGIGGLCTDQWARALLIAAPRIPCCFGYRAGNDLLASDKAHNGEDNSE